MLVLLLDLKESPLFVTFLPLIEKFLSLYSSAASMLPGKLEPRDLATGTPRSSWMGQGDGDFSDGLLDSSPWDALLLLLLGSDSCLGWENADVGEGDMKEDGEGDIEN